MGVLEKTVEKLCATCNAGLPEPGTGRPPTYCGTACRRAAEYDLRRLNSSLLLAEKHRVRVALGLYDPWLDGRQRNAAVRRIDNVINDLKARQLALLQGLNEEARTA